MLTNKLQKINEKNTIKIIDKIKIILKVNSFVQQFRGGQWIWKTGVIVDN